MFGKNDKDCTGNLWFNNIRWAILPNFVENFSKQNRNELLQSIYDHPDIIISGKFSILGCDNVQLGFPPDWHTDFKSGFRWNPYLVSWKVRATTRQGADLKVPWELSRFNWILPLAAAWRIKNEKQYAVAAKNLILDWIDKNPVARGVNWICPMDIGMRITNWIWALALLEDSNVFTEDEIFKIASAIYTASSYIMDHLEGSPSFRSNHYMGDITGVFHSALAFRGMKKADKWMAFATQAFEKEISRQVLDDGGDFEGSIPYHRLVLEFFFLFALLAKRNNIPLSDIFERRLKNMFAFTRDSLRPDGECPQIGDNDSGRQFVLSKRNINDHTYLCCWAALFYQDSSFKLKNVPFCPEALVLFGPDALKRWESMDNSEQTEIVSKPDFGLFIVREKANNLQITIYCGDIGQGGYGGHAHNDKLSFDFMTGGRPFIVDPGTALYTPDPERRNFFRSTASHNTLFINKTEQAKFNPFSLFSLLSDPHAECIEWNQEKNLICFTGQYTNADGVVHKRRFIWDKREIRLKIFDYVTSNGKTPLNSIESNLILHPDVRIAEQGPNHAVLENGGEYIKLEKFSGCDLTFLDWFYSPEYGVWMPTQKFYWCHEGTPALQMQFDWFLSVV